MSYSIARECSCHLTALPHQLEQPLLRPVNSGCAKALNGKVLDNVFGSRREVVERELAVWASSSPRATIRSGGQYVEVHRGGHFRASRCFVSTVGRDEKAIREYIE